MLEIQYSVKWIMGRTVPTHRLAFERERLTVMKNMQPSPTSWLVFRGLQNDGIIYNESDT
jgi:hypothetical protein